MDLIEHSEPNRLRQSLWCRIPERKARLFAVACCRAVYRSLADNRSRRAVKVAERHAEGRATDRELWLANDAAEMALDDSPAPAWPEFAASWVADYRVARAAREIACDRRGWSNPLPWAVKAALLALPHRRHTSSAGRHRPRCADPGSRCRHPRRPGDLRKQFLGGPAGSRRCSRRGGL